MPDFQKVVTFLEKRSPPLKFEYVGYDDLAVEVKVVDKIRGILFEVYKRSKSNLFIIVNFF
ncbi:MAG: hypothetical protein ACXABU_16250 [Candidatus Hodarchaeales archaeon]